MGTQPPRAERAIPQDLAAEHRALKEQTAALRREHTRLHDEGGTPEQHRRHIRDLRANIKALEHHVERLENLRHSPS